MAAPDPTRLPAPSAGGEPHPVGEERAVRLGSGRTLTIASAGDDALIELRGPSGMLELRIRTTEQGPVLEMETVRLSLQAAESIDIDCDEFNVNATRAVGLTSEGEISLRGDADVRVDANGDVHVTGETIYLN